MAKSIWRWAGLAVGVVLFMSVAGAAEPEPNKDPVVEVQFFFSKKDRDLPACDKVLAEVVKQLPQLRIERICTDDKAGSARLSQLEKSLGIDSPGDRSMFFGPYFLLSKGEQLDVETYFGPMMARLINQMNGRGDFKERLTPDIAAYAVTIFGKGAKAVIEPDQKGNFLVYYKVMKDGQFAGWIVDGFDPIGCPVCSAAQFLLAATPKASILNVRPVRPIERLSTKIPEKDIERYCAQYKGKTPEKPPVKLDGVARATKSTHAYIEAIKEILETLGKKINEKPAK